METLEYGAHFTPEQREQFTAAATHLYADGKSVRVIAATLGRSYGNVYRMLQDAGVSMRGRGGKRKT